MRKQLLASAAALITTPFMALAASASPCVSESVSVYEAPGFSCTVDGVTFSSISVNTIGLVTLGNFTPVINSTSTEFGLELNYAANTNGFNTAADVAWSYDVSGNLLDDAVAVFSGTTTGTGTSTLSETLSNNVTLALNSPGSTSVTFSPIASLQVIKDQNDFSGTSGSAESSILENEFSLTSTPIPAALPLFATGLVGLWGMGKRKSKKSKQNTALAT
jgi:hypothetical protein